MHRFLSKNIPRSFAKFARDKPHLNVGTIGHVDHGKTTLTSAITKYLSTRGGAKFLDYKTIDKAPEEQQRGITINSTTIEYQTATRHYGHADLPGHELYVKNMITGAAKMDAGILVVSAPDGAMPQTREHIMLCKQVGVKTIIVYLNKVDVMEDPEMHEIVEMEVKELLTKYGYDAENTVFVRGSALMGLNNERPEIGEQKIEELLKAMDEKIPLPERVKDKPFKMCVDKTLNIEGRGTVITGTIETGTVKAGDEIEIVGFNAKPKKTTITAIETFNKTLDYGESGDNVGLLIRGLTRKDVSRGMVLAKPGTVPVKRCFEAQVYFTTEEEGGRKKGFYTGYKPQIFLRTADVAGEIVLPENVKIGMPGDNMTVKIRLISMLPVEKGLHFAMRESGKTIGHGVVSAILEDNAIEEGIGRKMKAEQSQE